MGYHPWCRLSSSSPLPTVLPISDSFFYGITGSTLASDLAASSHGGAFAHMYNT